MELARFGATPVGGVHRLALSEGGDRRPRQACSAGRAMSGLDRRSTRRRICSCACDGREPDLPPLLVGSHIDSQPTGGKFDGAYGVLAAFEAVEAILGSGQQAASLDRGRRLDERGRRALRARHDGLGRVHRHAQARRRRDGSPTATACSVRQALDRVLARRARRCRAGRSDSRSRASSRRISSRGSSWSAKAFRSASSPASRASARSASRSSARRAMPAPRRVPAAAMRSSARSRSTRRWWQR